MVKTPRTRHSKTQREPVTIDLDPDQVRRETADGGAAAKEPVQTAKPDADASGKTETMQPSSSVAPEKEKVSSAAAGKPGEFGRPSSGSGISGNDKPKQEKAEEPKSQSAKPATAAKPSGRGAGGMFGAGVAGGVIALALAAGLQWSGLLPGLRPEPKTADPAIETLRQQLAALETKLNDQQEALQATNGEDVSAALTQATDLANSLDGRISALSTELSTLQQSVSSGGAGEGPGLEALSARVAKIEEAAPSSSDAGAVNAAVEPVSRQVAELQVELGKVSSNADQAAKSASDNAAALANFGNELATLKDRVEEGGSAAKLAAIMAATALKSAVDRGSSFSGELDAFSAVAPEGEAGALEALRPFAATGLPSRASLAVEAPQVASSIVQATNRSAASDGGMIDSLMASARSLVVVRPVGSVEGSEPPAIAARMEAAVIANDYRKALAEYATLPEAGKAAAADFARKLEARQAADEALDRALSNALKGA